MGSTQAPLALQAAPRVQQDSLPRWLHRHARAAPQATIRSTQDRHATAVQRGRIPASLDRRLALRVQLVTRVLHLQVAAQAVAAPPVIIRNLARVFVYIALLGNTQTRLDR